MAVNQPRAIVDQFYAAWRRKDFVAVRRLLHDNLAFHGPFDTFDNADDYIAAITQLSAIVTDLETQYVFVDGSEVCTIYNLVTATPAGSAPVAEWDTIVDGKISAIRAIFDSRPFAPPSGS